MIKKSFILSCISAVAFSFDDMEVEMMTQVQAHTQLDASALLARESGDRRTRKANRRDQAIAELMADDGDLTLEEAERLVDEAHEQRREEFEAWKAEKKQELIDDLKEENPDWTEEEAVEEAERIIAERKEERRANGGGCPNRDQDEEEDDDDDIEDDDEEDETNLAQVQQTCAERKAAKLAERIVELVEGGMTEDEATAQAQEEAATAKSEKKARRKAKKEARVTELMEEGMTEEEARAQLKEECAARKAARNSAAQVGSKTSARLNTKSNLNSALANANPAPLTGGLAQRGKNSLGQIRSNALDEDATSDVTPGEEIILTPDATEGQDVNVCQKTGRRKGGMSIQRLTDQDQEGNLAQVASKAYKPQIRFQDLAQTDAQSSNHSCEFAHQRNKDDLVDFYGIRDGSDDYSDTDFSADDTALFWSDIGESNQGWNGFEWKRAGVEFDGHSLFGTDGVTPADVRQGSIGNCWFLSAISALSEEPGRIERVFVNDEKSDRGIYAVNFYTLGVPHTVIIDDYIPVQTWGSHTATIFSKMGPDQALWAPLLEKAFGKLHGNYGHTVGGDSRRAARTLSGGPYESFAHASFSEDEIWNQLSSHDSATNLIQVNTSGSNNAYEDENGLVNGHAYTVLGVFTTSNNQQLVKMRNPWASEQYRGLWCDGSSEWNSVSDQDKADAGYSVDDDGVFFMPLSLFYSTFTYTHFTHDTTGWASDYFLMLDDQTNPNGEFYYCGAECTRHTVTIESDTEQVVYVTAHTWDKRSMGSTCNHLWYNTGKYHMIKAPHDPYYRVFSEGDHQLEPFTLAANTPLDIDVEFDWSNPAVSADWSVTIWAESGTVSVKYKDDAIQTQELPLLEGSNSDGDSNPDPSPAPAPAPAPAPEPEPAPAPAPAPQPNPAPIPAPVHGPQYEEFITWADQYEPHLNFGGCGVGLIEDYEWTEDWEIQYKTVMKNECENWQFNIKVYQSKEDWEDLEEVYQTFSENNTLNNDSVIRECEEEDWGYINVMGCTFILGTVDDYEERGLTHGEQRTAGWLNKPGQYGIRSYSYSWTYVCNGGSCS